MRLPTVEQPQTYRGLYVYDFGEWTALGYTAEEIAALLESEQFRGGKIYKIHNATPDGQFELRGIAPERFHLESGLFFRCPTLEQAERDFAELKRSSERTSPPCRAKVHLADRGSANDGSRYTVALIYPAEYEDEMGRWLLDIGYQGGAVAEGGPSHVTNYYEDDRPVLERAQLWPADTHPARTAEEVYASVRQAVQR